MCTAITFKADDFYFGRNLDLEYRFQEKIVITPRNFKLKFRFLKPLKTHFAICGMATVVSEFPLYYDAFNEKGLCIAALNFPQNAFYNHPICDKENIAPFEIIPFILGSCSSVNQAKEVLSNSSIVDVEFDKKFKNTPLHFIIADKVRSITVEQTKNGLEIFQNPVGVLTNNPPFEMQLFNLNNYLNLTSSAPKNRFCKGVSLKPYSRGMGAIGLPGDLSSASRFVRATFVKMNSLKFDNELENVSQFFHVLDSVCQQKGCVKVGDDYEFTLYSSCCNADKGVYYYKTYNNSQINAVNMFKENLDSKDLLIFKLQEKLKINNQN